MVANYTQIQNHNSISFGYKSDKLSTSQYQSDIVFQVNPISFDWQINDFYNNGKTSYSYLMLSFTGLYAISKKITSNSDSKYSHWSNLFDVPSMLSILSNSKINYNVISFVTSNNNFISTSIYAKNKLDYFIGNEENWWRWKPGFGIEVYSLWGQKTKFRYIKACGLDQDNPNEIELNNTYGISLELGLEKPIDFGVANPQSHKLTPYVNFIMMKDF